MANGHGVTSFHHLDMEKWKNAHATGWDKLLCGATKRKFPKMDVPG